MLNYYFYTLNPHLKRMKRCSCTLLSGKDVFGVFPTGYEKSLCYILLPMVFDNLYSLKPGEIIIIHVVVSLLVSLMNDQVKACIGHGIILFVTSKEESK